MPLLIILAGGLAGMSQIFGSILLASLLGHKRARRSASAAKLNSKTAEVSRWDSPGIELSL